MHGIIESKRGRAGGVRLRAQKVTLLDIWNIAFGEIDLKTPSVPQMKKPLKAFTDAMAETVIYKRRDA